MICLSQPASCHLMCMCRPAMYGGHRESHYPYWPQRKHAHTHTTARKHTSSPPSCLSYTHTHSFSLPPLLFLSHRMTRIPRARREPLSILATELTQTHTNKYTRCFSHTKTHILSLMCSCSFSLSLTLLRERECVCALASMDSGSLYACRTVGESEISHARSLSCSLLLACNLVFSHSATGHTYRQPLFILATAHTYTLSPPLSCAVRCA